MKKIAYVLFTNRISGAEKIVIEIIEEIKDRYDCTYICKDGEITDLLKAKGIKCITFETNKELLAVLKEGAFDIIHANDYKASLTAALSKTKVISHIHHNKIEMTKLSKLSILYGLFSGRMNKVVCVSKSIRDEMIFKGLIKNKTVVRYNWLNKKERVWEPEEKKDIDVLFVGRFEEAKDPIMFVNVIKDIVFNHKKDINVLMVGRGTLKESTLAYIKECKLENNIKVIDFSEEPHKYMKKSKVFFTPSKWEGFGLVFLEAIANNSVPVATPVGGIKEIFEGNDEYLGTTREEFVQKIVYLLDNDDKREEVAKKNLDILDRFDMKKNIAEIEKLYR